MSRPTYYTADELRARSADLWTLDLWRAAMDTHYEIYGQRDGDDGWRALSRSLLVEDRLAQKLAVALAGALQGQRVETESVAKVDAPDPIALTVEAIRDVIERERPKVGVAEMAFHLLDHLHERQDYTLEILRQLGYPPSTELPATRQMLSEWKREGARRKGPPCRLCIPANPRSTPRPDPS